MFSSHYSVKIFGYDAVTPIKTWKLSEASAAIATALSSVSDCVKT